MPTSRLITSEPGPARFGPFTLDLERGGLRRDGLRVSLPKQPTRVLTHLIQNAGRIVTREELRDHLWGSRIVEYDQGINHCIGQIRAVLGETAKTPMYIETVQRTGYRFIARVERTPRRPRTLRVNSMTTRLQRQLGAVFLLVAGVAVAWGAWGAPDMGGPPAASPGRPSIVVAPFENRGPGNDSAFVLGLSDLLATRLSATGRLDVRPSEGDRGRLMNNIDLKSKPDYLLTGWIQRDRANGPVGAVQWRVQLLRMAPGVEVWSDLYRGRMENTSIFLDDLVARVTQGAGGAMPGPATSRFATVSATGPAWQPYRLGLEHIRRTGSQEDLSAAIDLFRESVALDPNFAEAYGMLATSQFISSWLYGQQGQAPAGEASLQRARALDPEGFNTVLAMGFFHYYVRRDFDTALVYLERARMMDPHHPQIIASLAFVLRRLGQFAESTALLEMAFVLEPRSYMTAFNLALGLTRLREYDAADRYFAWAAAIAPGMANTYAPWASLRLLRNGDGAGALAILREGLARADGTAVLADAWTLARALAASDSEGARSLWLNTGFTGAATAAGRGTVLLQLHDEVGRLPLDSALASIHGHDHEGDEGAPDRETRHCAKLARLYIARRDYELGLTHARKALGIAGGSHDMFLNMDLRLLVAQALSGLGRIEESVESIIQLLGEPSSVSPAMLAADPIWRPLAGHTRLTEFLKRETAQGTLTAERPATSPATGGRGPERSR